MKKLTPLLVILLLLAGIWAGANWYIGQQTETLVKQQIEQGNAMSASSGVRQELISYRKTLFGAEAVTKLNFNSPPFDEIIGEVQLHNDIQNGPVFFGPGVQFGLSRWNTQLDMSALDEETRAHLQAIFAGKPPLKGKTLIRFDGSASYDFMLNPLKTTNDAGGALSLESLRLSGEATSGATSGTFQASAGQLELENPESHITLPSMQLDGNVTGMAAGQALGNFKLEAPKITLLPHGQTQPIRFDLNAQMRNEQAGNDLQGSLGFQASNIEGMEADKALKHFGFDVNYQGFNVAGLTELNRLQSQIQNLQNQVQWNADNLETPDGQRKLEDITRQAEDIAGQMLDTLFAKVFQADKSRIHPALTLESSQGKLKADADLTYAGSAKTPDNLSLLTYTPEDWIKLLKAKINITADTALAENAELQPLMNQNLFQHQGEQYVMQLESKTDGNVVLNGKSMPFSELLKLLPIPALAEPELDGNSLSVPEDIMQQIQEKGLTPEVIQLMEESDDMPRETVEMFKQLQQIQQQMQEGESPGQEPAGKPEADGKKAPR